MSKKLNKRIVELETRKAAGLPPVNPETYYKEYDPANREHNPATSTVGLTIERKLYIEAKMQLMLEVMTYSEFIRLMTIRYLEKDPDLMKIVMSYMNKKRSKSLSIERARDLKKRYEIDYKFGVTDTFSDEELENIFDILDEDLPELEEDESDEWLYTEM